MVYEMYRRIDWKERLLLLFPLLGILVSVGLLLIGFGRWRIMPLVNCFLEVQRDCFVAVQSFRDGEYESCRIYFEEIEGKRRKGFYVRVSGEGRSVIRGNAWSRVIYISSLGYSDGEIKTIYSKIGEKC